MEVLGWLGDEFHESCTVLDGLSHIDVLFVLLLDFFFQLFYLLLKVLDLVLALYLCDLLRLFLHLLELFLRDGLHLAQSLPLELLHFFSSFLFYGLKTDHDLGRLLTILLHCETVLSGQLVQVGVLGKTWKTVRLRVKGVSEHLFSDFQLLEPLFDIKHYKLQALDPQI